MDFHIFTGTPSQVGAAQGSLDPGGVRHHLSELLERPHDFQHPFFRRGQAFVKREFPDFAAEVAAFATAAGIDDFDAAWLLHVHRTGRPEDGCSCLALPLPDADGPILVNTNDVGQAGKEAKILASTAIKFLPDARPHGLLAIGSIHNCGIARAVNSSGLALGLASGHPKFHWPDDPEALNLHVLPRLLAQHCGDCDDVRHFLEQYRVSGEKGLNGITVDAKGHILGFELESTHIAFRTPEEGLLLEVNHWQHPELAWPSREPRAKFWCDAYYYNSQNRVQCFEAQRSRYRDLSGMGDLLDLLFDEPAPGQLLQRDEHGLLLIHTRCPADAPEHYQINSISQTLSLAASLLETAELLKGEELAPIGRMRERAAAYIEGFLTAPHDLERGIFAGTSRRFSNELTWAMPIWGSVYGRWPVAYEALICLCTYRLSGDERLLAWARAAGCAYVAERLPDGVAVPVSDAGLAVELLADLYDVTGEDRWRQGGRVLASQLMDAYLDGDLPRAAPGLGHYESQTVPGDFLHGLTRLALLSEGRGNCPLTPNYTCR